MSTSRSKHAPEPSGEAHGEIDSRTGRDALPPADVVTSAADVGTWSSSVEALTDENLTSVTLIGEIDVGAQRELDRVLEAAVEARSKLLLVDASRAEFVSTAAMLSIVSAARHVGRVLIYRPNSATRRIFRVIDPEGLCQSIT